MASLDLRTYGESGPLIIVLHGGPGAQGSVAAVARELGDSFRVWEPWQRRSGGEPLTVATHIADLYELIKSRPAEHPPALVGHSWGAMLALAFAAAHPDLAGPIVLAGCGTFDPAARRRLREILDSRMTDAIHRQMEAIAGKVHDPDELMNTMGDLLLPLHSYDLIPSELEPFKCDAQGFEETWADMTRLQKQGVYPAAFRAIRSPVLMLHGAADPHPGRMIRESFQPYLPGIEYREWEKCGHYPWLEKAVRREFFGVVKTWLLSKSA